jgi:hypothetical protein
MATWAEFEAEVPELARKCRDRIERFGYMLAGTIRRDGTPRISPVETHFVEGHLVVAMERATLKSRDVLRDPRLVLNAPIIDPDDPDAELKLRGRAVPVDAGDLREAAADTIARASGWRPPADWHVFSIDVEDAAHIAWHKGEMKMDRWRPGHPVEHTERRIALD